MLSDDFPASVLVGAIGQSNDRKQSSVVADVMASVRRRLLAACVGLLVIGMPLANPATSIAAPPWSMAHGETRSPTRKPDLVVAGLSAKIHSERLSGSFNVINTGSARARASTAAIFWWHAHKWERLRTQNVPQLATGNRVARRFSAVPAPPLPSGTYRLRSCADVRRQVLERHEANNCSKSVEVRKALGTSSPPVVSGQSSPPAPSVLTTAPFTTAPPPPGPTSPPPSTPDTTLISRPAALVTTASALFTFASNHADAKFECALDEAAWSPCTSPKQYNTVTDGSHYFAVRAVDAPGPDPTPAGASWTVDTTPPDVSVDAAPSGDVPLGPVTIAFSSSDTAASFTCTLDGAQSRPCDSPLDLLAPTAGPHTLQIVSRDLAGNASARPATVRWNSVAAEMTLCGAISNDLVLSPHVARRYRLTCDVTVAAGATLTIEPGTILQGPRKTFGGTSYTSHYVNIEGVLRAAGTTSSPVTFTSPSDNTSSAGDATDARPGDWGGIRVVAGGVWSSNTPT